MFENILHPEIQQYIRDHENDDVKAFVLKNREVHGTPAAAIAEQISGRGKAKVKLPTWYKTPGIIFPPALNLEQCSSEITANFKAKILAAGSTNSIVDLTGGFGVDTFSFSKYFKEVHYVEPDAALFEIVTHNLEVLGGEISAYNTDAEDFISSPQRRKDAKHYGSIFIDPSRRKSMQKVFKLIDCEPNIVSLQDQLFTITDKIMIKTSPLLDIQQGLSELNNVSRVYVVAVKNEVKELLFICEKSNEQEPEIHAVNIVIETQPDDFSFSIHDERDLSVSYRDPQQYLFEPNAAIQKSGAFKTIAKRYNLKKIHPNTHLYTSNDLVADFPGRVFKIEDQIKPDRKILERYFPEGKANVTTRNYPLTPEALKKKTGLKDGGEKFLIGFSGEKKKFLVVGERI